MRGISHTKSFEVERGFAGQKHEKSRLLAVDPAKWNHLNIFSVISSNLGQHTGICETMTSLYLIEVSRIAFFCTVL